MFSSSRRQLSQHSRCGRIFPQPQFITTSTPLNTHNTININKPTNILHSTYPITPTSTVILPHQQQLSQFSTLSSQQQQQFNCMKQQSQSKNIIPKFNFHNQTQCRSFHHHIHSTSSTSSTTIPKSNSKLLFHPITSSQSLLSQTHPASTPSTSSSIKTKTNFQRRQTTILTQQKRQLFGIVENIKCMDWDRVKRNWKEPFVWLEEYKLGRYRCDQKRILFHSRRTGGVKTPFDQRRGKHLEEWEYLDILQAERGERFRRMNLWRKAIIFRRWAISRSVVRAISAYNTMQDLFTKFLSWLSLNVRGWRWHRERRLLPLIFRLVFRVPIAILLRWVSSFFLRVELHRIWTLRDLDWQMQNKVSGELLAKYPWPQKYSFAKYVLAFIEPLFNTFNHFHGIRLLYLNVLKPLFLRWWFHINDYKPYLGFIKFGIIQWAIVIALGSWTGLWTRFRIFDSASYAYKADFGHNYIALMTRAVYADVLISLIEDGLIQVDALTCGHDFEINTKLKSQEYKFIDDEVEKRCNDDPQYREQLRLEGIPVTLEEFFGVENIPHHLPPKEQVLYILRQYNNYQSITREMLNQLKPLREFTDRYIRILYSLGLVSETTWINKLMGNISSSRTFLQSYRALLNIIGTRDGDSIDPSIQHNAMIRALTRKFDLTILPPSPEHVYQMKKLDRPYALQFQRTPWDRFAALWEEKQHKHAQQFIDGKPGMGLDLYGGKEKSQYDPMVHGEHQYFNKLPSVTNGSSDVNLKGLGKAFFDPYVSVLLPAFHARPLDHEMIVLQQIKLDLIQLARISPEYKDTIPIEYNPFEYRSFIQSYLRIFGVNKLTTWEKMMGRDFIFETPDLEPSSYDTLSRKHAKWLWSQVLACVTEKVENNNFASPMYYIEDTCPALHESRYRSKVDTINRFQFKNLIGRPISEQQRRALDYQLIDPYAEEHAILYKRFRHDSHVMDFNNTHKLDSRVDRVYKTPGDDLGFWPGGRSVLPFLGVNKYRGTNPLTGFIGMLATSCENLMTINRTAKEVMLKKTDIELLKPIYDPFGPQYRQNDGSYANTPENDPRYTSTDFINAIPSEFDIGYNTNGIHNNKIIIPTQNAIKGFTLQHEIHQQMAKFPSTSSSLSTTTQTNPIAAAYDAINYNTFTPQVSDGNNNNNNNDIPNQAYLKDSEKELLYRLQDNTTFNFQLHDTQIAARDMGRIHRNDDMYKDPRLSFVDHTFVDNDTGQIYNNSWGLQIQHENDYKNAMVNTNPELVPLFEKYTRALELYQSDPFKYPNPLPPRQPFDRKSFLSNSIDEKQRFGE